MTDYVWDIESFPNVFTLSLKEAGTTNRWRFEISHRRNDYDRLVQMIQWLAYTKARMVGFNNVGFDYPVLHFILEHPGPPTAAQINRKVGQIINVDHSRRFDHIIWDRDRYVEQIDLLKIHHFDNVARFTSLKVLEFNMRSGNIQDLPFAPGSVLTDSQIDTLISYNDHDVDQTEAFYFKSLDQIRFREELSKKYSHNFLNHNDTKIGKDYFIMELERLMPGSCYTTVDGKRTPRQTWRSSIALRDVIFPYVQFRRPEFQQVHQWLMAQTITETKGVFEKLHCVVDGFQFDFGTGGIHGSVSSRTVTSDADHEIVDIDVTSYYPTLAIANRLHPAHLGEAFCDIYKDVFDQRAMYPKGTPENAMLKLALNGVYGDSNNVYSPFYDPAYTMSITINGQLLLCMLAEYLMDIPDLQMIQVNTDGVTVRIPRTRRPDLQRVMDWWQAFTCLKLEEAIYSRMFIRDVNNYLAEYADGGKVKRKGAYEYKLGWHQNHSALIIPMAAEAALVEGLDVRQFILNHDCLDDFMLRAKIPRNSRLVLITAEGERQLQNVTRYYISKSGGSLVKIMPPLAKAPDKERRIGIDVGWMVTECNDIRRAVGQDINFEYYIKEAEKLVKPLK